MDNEKHNNKDNENKQHTVHYLCFYAEKDNMEYLVTFPSAWNKIEYIINSIHKCGYNVNLISAAQGKKNGFNSANNYTISDNEKHLYLSSFKTQFALINKLSIILIWIQIILYFIFKVKKNDVILVYHSLFYIKPLTILKKIFNKNFILEIEEYYSSTDNIAESYYEKEREFVKLAKSCICVNDIIGQEMENKGIKNICAYGDYRVPPKYDGIIKNDKIKLVYAGVIECNRKAAFIATESMEFLGNNYELHILGFGNEKDISKLNVEIKRINKKLGYEAVKYNGHMTGEKYFSFLQNCDIGLSTHIYTKESLQNAKYMFSSKVLSYLSNNLRVVAQRLECLENSKVGFLLNFYDEPDPLQIANVIMKIKIEESYNSRKLIQNLNEEFVKDLKQLLED